MRKLNPTIRTGSLLTALGVIKLLLYNPLQHFVIISRTPDFVLRICS
jgi:hypothetical protein